MDLPADLDPGARAYIEEVKERAISTGVDVNFGLARAESLPIRSGSMNKIYMSQVIHWLAFADDDVFGENVDHVNESISEFHRVLRSGGQIVLDTSGHQTGLEDHQLNGVRLKDTHVLSHPFYRAFILISD
ncbi:MAG: class I SAM-dependent methyltransferase [Candidatus Curtissbacteria bacterium]|nr:class I SAM-dependent methyltransferase [Candidatus Curtissbacteria bacterium]